ncbi:DUF3772 domain-containing protein [Tianweitania sediminis]|uniref:DUF3772 domain-containing protein n=1 Tax=Tianweitania sediminis TaxID=1502156 RepID=A0A8J7UKR6_9HYPH|nr:DUF3772 domain-containing protein [Tianweitania sediminis]MBP0441468.1 DUF3772 domain-containing protein [Tianweitania sediminis]
MKYVEFTCRILLFLCLFFGSAEIAAAQSTAGALDPVETLDQSASELEAVRSSLQTLGPDGDYDALRTRSQTVAAASDASAEALVSRLAAVQAILETIGDPAEGEAPDVVAQRSELTLERDELDSNVKRARLLATAARETIETINRVVTDRFNRNTLERVASPFSASYWQNVSDNWVVDLSRLSDFATAASSRVANAVTPQGWATIGATTAAAIFLVLPVRLRLKRFGQNYARDRAPHTRARRSGLAVWFLLVGSITGSLGVTLLVQGLEWADALTPAASSLAWNLALASVFGAVVVSMGDAYLLVDRGSWRLLPISDQTARALRFFPVVTALIVLIGTGLVEVNRIVGASPPASVTANLVTAVFHVVLLASVLAVLGRLRTLRDREAEEVTARLPLVTAAMLLGWLTVTVCVLAIARGNVNLALLIGREIVWAVVVIAGAYLLTTAVDDLITTLLAKDSRAGRAVARGFGFRTETVQQFGLVVSILLRVMISFFAAGAVLAPLGGGTAPAYTQLSGITSVAVAGIVIQPGAVLRAIAAIFLGLGAVRLLDRWMNNTFLPATSLDAGARNSVSTILRYVGIVVAVSWAVSMLGIGLERVALLASALSVGIGFGLQAITQNFISGLILLAERPVKIGDTIRVGADEGDVKRINVRSTEIQIGDRSTLIIPNSELITKSVRNMTLANPLGRVQITFSVPMEEDPDEIIAILLDLFAEHEAVLDEPTPSVMIDSLVDGKIAFNGISFVSSPRLVYGTRSDLLLRLLRRLKSRGFSAEATLSSLSDAAGET